ncbi:hypothetical protein D3C81_182630 [compost metagenome]
MAWSTPRTNWNESHGVGVDDLNRIEGNIAQLAVNGGGYGSTGGSGALYTVNIPGVTSLVEGLRIAVKLHIDSAANPTINVNALGAYAIKKANGSPIPAGNLKKDSVYSLVFNGSAFILQGEGGGGTATAGDIRAGKTAETDGGPTTGTLPVRSGGGVSPTANQIVKQAGIYDADIIIAGVPINTNALLEGNVVAGQAGSMPNRSARDHHYPSQNVTVWPGDRVFLQPPWGYYSGDSWVTAPAPALVSNNIREGQSILGVPGTMAERGRATSSNGWVNMQATVDAPWEINVGYRPQLVFYQFWIYYGVTNIYNEYGMNMVWGYGMFSKSTSASMENNRAANGFSSGGSSSMSYPIGPQGDTWNLDFGNWQRPIDFNNWENINTPTRGNNTGYFGGMTETGFRIGYGHYFRDPRGQNAAQINYYII